MNHWHKYKNYKRRENGGDTYSYFIIVDGTDVEVNEDVYRVYASSGRKMKYMELDLKRDRAVQDENGRTVVDENGLPIVLPEREVSLDKLIGEDWDFPSDEPGAGRNRDAEDGV